MDFDAEHRSLVSGVRARASPPEIPCEADGSKILISSEIPVSRPVGTFVPSFAFLGSSEEFMEAMMGRGILLWLLGVPIPVIILLWLFFGH